MGWVYFHLSTNGNRIEQIVSSFGWDFKISARSNWKRGVDINQNGKAEKEAFVGRIKNLCLDVLCLGYIFDD